MALVKVNAVNGKPTLKYLVSSDSDGYELIPYSEPIELQLDESKAWVIKRVGSSKTRSSVSELTVKVGDTSVYELPSN